MELFDYLKKKDQAGPTRKKSQLQTLSRACRIRDHYGCRRLPRPGVRLGCSQRARASAARGARGARGGTRRAYELVPTTRHRVAARRRRAPPPRAPLASLTRGSRGSQSDLEDNVKWIGVMSKPHKGQVQYKEYFKTTPAGKGPGWMERYKKSYADLELKDKAKYELKYYDALIDEWYPDALKCYRLGAQTGDTESKRAECVKKLKLAEAQMEADEAQREAWKYALVHDAMPPAGGKRKASFEPLPAVPNWTLKEGGGSRSYYINDLTGHVADRVFVSLAAMEEYESRQKALAAKAAEERNAKKAKVTPASAAPQSPRRSAEGEAAAAATSSDGGSGGAAAPVEQPGDDDFPGGWLPERPMA